MARDLGLSQNGTKREIAVEIHNYFYHEIFKK